MESLQIYALVPERELKVARQCVFRAEASFKKPDSPITPIIILAAACRTIYVAFLPQADNGKVILLLQPTITYAKPHTPPDLSCLISEKLPQYPRNLRKFGKYWTFIREYFLRVKISEEISICVYICSVRVKNSEDLAKFPIKGIEISKLSPNFYPARTGSTGAAASA
jgi:hypothetical protein